MNARSLQNKNELLAHVNYQLDFRDACILALMETWLREKDSHSAMSIDGCGAPLHPGQETLITPKSCGGGVRIYINNRWCKTIVVRERLSTKDLELLSVSIRPFYLPREFLQIFVAVVYVHPNANVNTASEFIL